MRGTGITARNDTSTRPPVSSLAAPWPARDGRAAGGESVRPGARCNRVAKSRGSALTHANVPRGRLRLPCAAPGRPRNVHRQALGAENDPEAADLANSLTWTPREAAGGFSPSSCTFALTAVAAGTDSGRHLGAKLTVWHAPSRRECSSWRSSTRSADASRCTSPCRHARVCAQASVSPGDGSLCTAGRAVRGGRSRAAVVLLGRSASRRPPRRLRPADRARIRGSARSAADGDPRDGDRRDRRPRARIVGTESAFAVGATIALCGCFGGGAHRRLDDPSPIALTGTSSAASSRMPGYGRGPSPAPQSLSVVSDAAARIRPAGRRARGTA